MPSGRNLQYVRGWKGQAERGILKPISGLHGLIAELWTRSVPVPNDDPAPTRPNAPDVSASPPRPMNRELAGLCVALGLVCMIFPFLATWLAPTLFPPSIYLLSLSMAFGMFLTAVGGWVSGKWRGWTLGGAAATVVALFTLIQSYGEAPKPEKRVVANIAAPELYTSISAVEVVEESGRRLYVAPNRELKHANVLIEQANLGNGCLAFIFAPQAAAGAADGESEPIDVKVPTAFFRDAMDGATETPHHERLFYSHAGRALLRNDPEGAGDPAPISGPGICSASVSVPLGTGRRQASLFGWVSGAFAGELSDLDLIWLLVSTDALTRRDAREQIAARGPAILPALMAAIPDRSDPDHYRYALGAAVALARMIQAGYPAEKVRQALSDQDVARLAALVAHPDETMRRAATAAVVALEDDRTIDPLVSLLGEQEVTMDSKYSAALALRQTAPSYEEPVQRDLVDATRSLKAALNAQTSGLLDQLPSTDGQIAQTGWVFLGASYGKGWAERSFAWPDDSPALPAIGSSIEAVAGVDLRDGPASFTVKEGWREPGIVGRVEKGQMMTVRQIEEVAEGIYWAEVEVQS